MKTDTKDMSFKINSLVLTLKNTVNEVANDWNSKKREKYIFDALMKLDYIENAQKYIKNKELIKNLKSVYKGSNPKLFTTKNLTETVGNVNEEKIYVIHEPFGSKASPDFLFITSKGLFGLEDKSSKNQKVTFNTGTPGGNKFIMYYDKKLKKVYLITGERWGWSQNIENEFKEFTKEMILIAKREFEKRFGDKVKNMEYYARPMLVDKNKVKDIAEQNNQDVLNFLTELI